MKKQFDELRKRIVTKSDGKDSGRSELIGSIFFAFIALILTIVNIAKNVEITMTIATAVLTLGFIVTAVLAYKRKLTATRIIIIILCCSIFSMFALIGGNDGFAILWILLVPLIGSIWVGLKYGTILGGYFQVFLIVIFYTPLSEYVKDYYTPTFMLRFPLLYLASFGAITFLMWQRENLYKKLHKASYFDALTDMYNRRYCDDVFEKIRASELDPKLVLFSFDLNQLKVANDTYGHQAGDELLKATADIIKRNFKGADCFRTGGDEFVALSTELDPNESINNMKEDSLKWHGEYAQSISISVGYASVAENPGVSFEQLCAIADAKMYDEKAKFYEANGIEKR